MFIENSLDQKSIAAVGEIEKPQAMSLGMMPLESHASFVCPTITQNC